MFHNDTQTQHTNNWKRVTNEHPINRILTSYFNTDKKTKNSNSNVQSNNQKSETNHIMQRQRVIRSFLNRSDESEVGKQFPSPIVTSCQYRFNFCFLTAKYPRESHKTC